MAGCRVRAALVSASSSDPFLVPVVVMSNRGRSPSRSPKAGVSGMQAPDSIATSKRAGMKGEKDRPPRRASARIEDDTPIIPCVVAEHVCEGASVWLGEALPRKWMLELAERANVVYQHNARFRQLLRKRGDAGRDWLAAFMRHWLYALLASRRPDLCQRLPRAYAVGRDLPPPH